MKKIINDPYEVVEDTLSGILKAYPHHLRMAEDSKRVLVRKDAPIKGKVGIATGGGSGHIPLFLGYVGPGLVDSVSVGNVFSSPSTEDMLVATKEADGGAGVLHLFGNYSGDVMAFGMAAEMAELEDIPVKTVLGADDVASGPPEEADKRRGIAGILFAYKIAGAKADTGASLDEVETTTQKVMANTRSMGVALSPCTIPAAGEPTFTIGDDEMELGMGIHGEPGIQRGKLRPAREIAQDMTQRVINDLPYKKGDQVAILINGLGATPPEELFILYDTVHDVVSSGGIDIYKAYIGEYATSMEMAGCSVTLIKLDDELRGLLDAPAHSPFLLQWR